jgi:hypothetical protein
LAVSDNPGFNAKTFTTHEWAVLGGVFVAFIGLFLRSYSVSAGPFSASVSGWHWAGLWVPVLFLGAPAAAIVALRTLRADLIQAAMPVTPRLAAAALLAVGVVIQVIRALTFPGSGSGDFAGTHFSVGASYGTYIVTIAMAVAAGVAILDFRASGEPMPTMPSKPGAAAS